MFYSIRWMGLGLILSMTVLGACGGADDDPIVARVNQEAITEAEVDALLAERGLTPGNVADEQRTSALEELITERLMAQGARSMGLAHDASTAPVANRLLARAYLEKQLGDLPRPSDEVVEAYFLAHPELFAKRRRYHLQEIAVEATGDDLAAIDQRSRSINTFNELVDWLQQRGLPFRTGAAVRSADELPRDLLAHLKDAREGEVVGISTPSGRTVVQVVEVTPDPVSFTRAEADIRKYLANRKVERLLQQIDAELRVNAKIERFGLYRRH